MRRLYAIRNINGSGYYCGWKDGHHGFDNFDKARLYACEDNAVFDANAIIDRYNNSSVEDSYAHVVYFDLIAENSVPFELIKLIDDQEGIKVFTGKLGARYIAIFDYGKVKFYTPGEINYPKQ